MSDPSRLLSIDTSHEAIADAPHVGAMLAALERAGLSALGHRPLTDGGGVAWALRPALAEHGLVLDEAAGLAGLRDLPLEERELARLRSWMAPLVRRALLAPLLPSDVPGIRALLGPAAGDLLDRPAMHLVAHSAPELVHHHRDGLYSHTVGSILEAPRGPCLQMRTRADPVPPALGRAVDRALQEALLAPADASVLSTALQRATPVHPDAAWLWSPLFEQWSTLATHHGPGGTLRRTAWHVEVSLDGPSLRFAEGDHELARIVLRRAPIVEPLRLAPAPPRDDDPHRPRSAVGRPTPALARDLCAHALDLLRRRSGLAQSLQAAMGSPSSPGRVLALLDLQLGDRSVGRDMLGWRVSVDTDGRVHAYEVQCTPVPEGWKVRRFPNQEARREVATIPADERIMEARRGLLAKRLSVHHEALAVGMIRAMIGHPRVFVGERGDRPLSVTRSDAVLDLRAMQRGLQARWEILPGEFVSSSDALRLLREHGDGRYGLHWTSATDLTIVDFRHAEGIALALDHAVDWVAPAAIDGFLQRLPGIANLGRVRLDTALEGHRRPPQHHIVVRLASQKAKEITVELRMAPGGPDLGLYPPGHGPAALYGTDGAERFAVHRDLAAEERLAGALAAELRLSGIEPSSPWRWFGLQLPEAVEVMKAIADRPHLDVQWLTGKLSLSTAEEPVLRMSLLERGAWYEVDGSLEVEEGVVVPLCELLRQLRSGQVVVTLDNERIIAFTEELRQELVAIAHLAEPTGQKQRLSPWVAPSFADVLGSLHTELDLPTSWGPRLAALRGEGPAPELPELQADLRSYQVDGIRWLQRLSAWAPGACLADDMGLGKTLQALGLLVHRAHEGPALVVVPTSVLRNWEREAERFAPQLVIHRSHGADRPRNHSKLAAGDVLLTTWGTMLRDVPALRTVSFSTIVLDEAQAIKNARTVRARAVRELQGGFLLALSGTPVENAPEELWALFDALVPGLLGDEVSFDRRFATPMRFRRGGDAAAMLSKLVRPFLLRRRKDQVATDLPPRDEVVVDVALSPHEREAYEQVRRSILEAISRAGIGSGRQVLAGITRLRQLASHPRLVDPTGPAASSKLTEVRRTLLELVAAGHQVLVFSQWVTLLDLLAHLLSPDGLRLARLDGGMSPAARQQQVDHFQAGHADAFLISLHAGGVGLNLTAATYVLHLDSWWNPAAHDQATDRAHRIGQTQPVTVLHFVSEGTVEDAIVRLQEKKRRMVEGLLEGTDAAGRLTAQELIGLIEDGGVSEVGLGYEAIDAPTEWPEPQAVPSDPADLLALLGPTLPWPLPGLDPALAHRFVAWGAALRAQRSPSARNQAKALYRMLRWALGEGHTPEHVDDLEEVAVAYRRALDLGLVIDPRRGDRSTAPTAVRKWLASRG